jgi:predicted phosphoribosyltransferase
MTSLTINIEETLKSIAQKKAQKDGVTLTFVVIQALKAYNDNKLKFGLVSDDNDITASFDVSTKAGKKACIKSFESLVK